MHEISNPVFGENQENIVNLSSAESTQRVVKVNIQSPFTSSYKVLYSASVNLRSYSSQKKWKYNSTTVCDFTLLYGLLPKSSLPTESI